VSWPGFDARGGPRQGQRGQPQGAEDVVPAATTTRTRPASSSTPTWPKSPVRGMGTTPRRRRGKKTVPRSLTPVKRASILLGESDPDLPARARAGGVSVPMPPPPPGMVALQAETSRLSCQSHRCARGRRRREENDDDDELSRCARRRSWRSIRRPPRTRPASAASWKSSAGSPYRSRLSEAIRARRGLGEDAGQPARPGGQPARARHRGAAVGITTFRSRCSRWWRSTFTSFRPPGESGFGGGCRARTRYIPMMTPILEAHGLPRDLVYLSNDRERLQHRSQVGAAAVGPWPVSSAGTAKMYDVAQRFLGRRPARPAALDHRGARFLHEPLRAPGNWYLAWAGYNTAAAGCSG